MKKTLIVGSGLYGSVLARELTNNGYKCHVIERRNHIGGNCYTENVNGINVHKYGPHIFHTSNKIVLDYLLKHTTINHFSCRPKIFSENKNLKLETRKLNNMRHWKECLSEYLENFGINYIKNS